MLLDKEVEKKVDEFENEDKKPYNKYSKKNEKVVEKPVLQVVEVVEEDDGKGFIEEATVIKNGKVTNCENLNIRKDASKDANILKVVPKDTVVIIDDDNRNGFYNVILEDGTEGYVMKEYITLI